MNEKVRNATKVEYDGRIFESKLELKFYKELIESGITDFAYNNQTHTIFSGFRMQNLYFYRPDKSKSISIDTHKIRDIKYTPDFVINRDDFTIYIETKGKENDTYPLKRKMFLSINNDTKKAVYFFEPHNHKQIMETIDIIKEIVNMSKFRNKVLEYIASSLVGSRYEKDFYICKDLLNKLDYIGCHDIIRSIVNKEAILEDKDKDADLIDQIGLTEALSMIMPHIDDEDLYSEEEEIQIPIDD